jgi:hypothetical protein
LSDLLESDGAAAFVVGSMSVLLAFIVGLM